MDPGVTSDAPTLAPTPCPRCGAALAGGMVRTLLWHDDRPVIVEDVPAMVCSGCAEQFYDEAVSEALQDLAAQGFPRDAAVREVTAPVFSLKGRIWQRPDRTDDATSQWPFD